MANLVYEVVDADFARRLEKQNVEMMAMLKRTTLAIKYITDGTIQSNSMLNVLLIESAELIKKIEVEK